ncbi:MAG: FRG domain-containing protein [Burkholderiaceae bacterium]
MNGQWIGDFSGTNTGTIMVNMDSLSTHFAGVAYVNDARSGMPGIAVFLKTKDKKHKFHLTLTRISFSPTYRGGGEFITWDQFPRIFPDIVLPTNIAVEGEWSDTSLTLNWTTDIGTNGNCTLHKGISDPRSGFPLKTMGWADFKRMVAQLDHRRFIFRGQSDTWPLRTSFHRTGRADLLKFLNVDVPTLHRTLSARTKHIFNLEMPNQNGAFLNLVQHHGYPTPLLDWSFSPFVGAFFAYRGISSVEANKASKTKRVRIFIFDQKQWREDFPQMTQLSLGSPHFSLWEFIAIDNERMIPQQGISSVTNVDDIERYLAKCCTTARKTYLRIVELPWKDRDKVMKELSLMGITAGSLFPGLDGACEELRERMLST